MSTVIIYTNGVCQMNVSDVAGLVARYVDDNDITFEQARNELLSVQNLNYDPVALIIEILARRHAWKFDDFELNDIKRLSVHTLAKAFPPIALEYRLNRLTDPDAFMYLQSIMEEIRDIRESELTV